MRKTIIGLFIVFAVIALGFQALQYGQAVKNGDSVYMVQVYDPATKSYDNYYTNNVKHLPNNYLEFKSSMGIVYQVESYSVKIMKLK